MSPPSSIMRAALLAASAVNAAELLQGRQMSTTTCAEVHIFLAKGNNEPYPGRQSKLVSAICDGLSSCDYEDIVMENMLSDEYCGAVYEGATNGYAQLNDYNSRCPDAKLVISGYSQGAQVVSDILGGGGGIFYNGCVEDETPQLSVTSDAGKMVKAVLTFGNVRHTADQPYNYESGSADNSYFPRPSSQLALLDTYQDLWRDYCVSGDPICAQGDFVNAHLTYFDNFTTEAAEWVKEKVDAATCDDCTTTLSVASTTASGSASGSASTSASASVTSSSSATTTGSGSSTVTSGATTSTILPEATASTTENLSSVPTVAASGTASASSTGSSGSTTNSESVSIFGLAVAAAFAFWLV
ncbi:putative Cutinase [Seiridium cardinale]